MMQTDLHKSLAGLVIAVALALHAFVIYYAHEHQLSSPTSGGKAFMEHQQMADGEETQTLLRQEEIRRKNEQLATLFQEMQQSYQQEEIPLTAISQQSSASQEPAELKLSDTSQVTTPDIEVLYPDNNFWMNEMIRATEMAQGQLEPSHQEFDSADAIKIGKASGTKEGTASINRSGMLEQGYTDSLLGSKTGFSDTLDNLQASLKRADGVGGGNHGRINPLGNIANSDDFTLDIQVAPRLNGRGYLFRIELIPKPQVRFRRIRQNYFFLVDRSHSIRYARYQFSQKAVGQALETLQPGDTFNILVFDDHVVAFAPQNVPWTPENVASGQAFITQQKYGGLFAATDLYASLGKIVPAAVAENEVNTAILLSDGDTSLSSEKQRESIEHWTRRNSGKVSLYSVASGKGNHLALLDLLSFFNKGSLHYAALDRDIGSSLLQLMQMLKNPIGKEMTVKAVREMPELEITLYPTNERLPNLYEHSPFVVYGTINRLHDFHLFFQGKYYDKTLDIKHRVSFEQAKQTDSANLEKRLAVYQAYGCYAAYLANGDSAYLNRAKELLKPYKLPLAFK
ncbi:MAG: hypothetical protein LLG04_00200 [Parachlamydia sp.]|nr:hypothetical protein [Parachlamydia sp.]